MIYPLKAVSKHKHDDLSSFVWQLLSIQHLSTAFTQSRSYVIEKLEVYNVSLQYDKQCYSNMGSIMMALWWGGKFRSTLCSK